jgi:hypothetical protein
MAERVYWHVGLPKTGTTYLQQILWSNLSVLGEQGISVPGAGHRQHLWAAMDLQERPRLERRHRDAPGSWERLASEVDAVDGTALLTHEFFCGADATQIRRGVERLGMEKVHVVVTARDAASMLAAGWQEDVKNGRWRTLRETAAVEQRSEFGWWVWDLGEVLKRWAAVVPADRIYVLPMPDRSAGPDQHWQNFADVIGFTGHVELPERRVNQSLGVVQIEALRLVNQHLHGFGKSFDRGVWIRGYLGEDHLARQDGERVRLDDDLIADCRRRSEAAIDLIANSAMHVVGSTDRLRMFDEVSSGRLVSSVTTLEIAEASAALAASMLTDVRRLSNRAAREPVVGPDAVPFRRRIARRFGFS